MTCVIRFVSCSFSKSKLSATHKLNSKNQYSQFLSFNYEINSLEGMGMGTDKLWNSIHWGWELFGFRDCQTCFCLWLSNFTFALLPLPSWMCFTSLYSIIESLRLEKTSKIIRSNHQPNTTMPTKPSPEVPHLYLFWTPLGMMTPPRPWAAYYNALLLFQ